jgi:5-methylcytosine-specific restriction endonuclease McrA
MVYHVRTRWYVYEKTAGRCHVCRKDLVFDFYGFLYEKGAWEIDHSNPKVRGGTDHRNNLLPACPRCNRSKQAKPTRAARAEHGYTRAPLSRRRQEERRTDNALFGGGAAAVAGGLILGPVGFFIGAALGGALGHDADVE